MSLQSGRYASSTPVSPADDWTFKRLTPPSRLYGANGLRAGRDGRLYVAQVVGSQISALDVDTGAIDTISPLGGEIIGPDDLAFDPAGNLYVTEFTEGRVSVRSAGGATRVLRGDVPGANPITFHQGRLFAGELRPAGRILEFDLDGGAPRVLLADVPMVNGFDVGPDGKLYFPVMATNEIWRIGLDGGPPETVVGDLGVPNSVKFDASGHIVSTQAASGQVLRIDPQTGARQILAEIAPGLDNSAYVGDRLFVSSISGRIHEVLGAGMVRPLVPHGLNFPLGLTVDGEGLLYVADGGFVYTLAPGEDLQVAGLLFSPGGPGYVRGVAAAGPGEVVVTTGMGEVARWRPAQFESEILAQGFDRLQGLVATPGGEVIFAESGAGRVLSLRSGSVEVLAADLEEPTGLALASDGTCYVSEAAAGRVVKLGRGRAELVLDGLERPQGVAVRDGRLYVVDVGAKSLVECDLASGARRTLAANLPVGAPPGVTPKLLQGIPPYAGPMIPFAGVAAGADGALYVSADAEGSVLEFRRQA